MQSTHSFPGTTAKAQGRTRRSYTESVEKLSAASVKKHFDAYVDIAWDDPDFAIDATDPRWAYHNLSKDTLCDTVWYRSLAPATQQRLGIHASVTLAKIGIQFESILQRGLLAYAERLPNGSPEFRYAYHEVIEEGHHSLMFQEFINRSREDPIGMPALIRRVGDRVINMPTLLPELFFLYVLGGEEPIDYVQREALRRKEDLPPVLRRIAEIHVTEEARHISFARAYLREHVPALSAPHKLLLAVSTPMLFGAMTPLMVRASADTVRKLAIPSAALREAYADNPAYEEHLAHATEKVRSLCHELGLMPRAAVEIWKAYRMWEEPKSRG